MRIRKRHVELEYETIVFDGICGVCGNTKLELRRVIHKTQSFELFVVVCQKCGHRDVTLMELGGGNPIELVIRVDEVSGLNTLVYRSPQADIFIPELGLELYHTAYTQPKITTIEGFLLEAKEKVESLFSKEESEQFLAKVEGALKGEVKFTFILRDQSGASWVIPAKTQFKNYRKNAF